MDSSNCGKVLSSWCLVFRIHVNIGIAGELSFRPDHPTQKKAERLAGLGSKGSQSGGHLAGDRQRSTNTRIPWDHGDIMGILWIYIASGKHSYGNHHAINGKTHYFYGKLLHSYGNHHAINGKTHYFYGKLLHSYGNHHAINGKTHYFYGKLLHSYGNHHAINGKTHYFDWSIFNSYVKLPEGMEIYRDIMRRFL